MKHVLLGFVFGLALVVGGCSLLEPALGIQTDPVTGEKRSDGKGGIVGSLVGTFLPWTTTVLGGLAAAYVEAKRRNWKAAATSTISAIEEFKASPEGKRVWEALKAKLGAKHADAHITALVEKVLGNDVAKV